MFQFEQKEAFKTQIIYTVHIISFIYNLRNGCQICLEAPKTIETSRHGVLSVLGNKL